MILSYEQIAELLNQPDLETVSGLRDRVMMELLYSTGMRRMELVNLQVFDVSLQRKLVLIKRGKGGKDRYLPLSEPMCAWLEKYLNDSRGALCGPLDDDRLFITDYGEAFKDSYLGDLVKRYMKQAGIEVNGSCHLLRHAMATHMLENGADIRFIQAMLGHASLETTEIYTQVSVEKLREIHNATHPLTTPRAAAKTQDSEGSA